MRPLPSAGYSFAQWKTAKAAPDYHIEFEGHRYSVPYGFVGKRVDVRITANVLEVFSGSKKIASHMRSLSRRGFTTAPSHMPESHRQGQWNPQRLEAWAEKIGPQALVFTERVLGSRGHKEHGYRTLLGVFRLEKTHGKERLEAACERANAVGALSYGSIKSILEKNLEFVPFKVEAGSLPLHDNVRGAAYYAGREASCAN